MLSGTYGCLLLRRPLRLRQIWTGRPQGCPPLLLPLLLCFKECRDVNAKLLKGLRRGLWEWRRSDLDAIPPNHWYPYQGGE